MPIVFLVPAPFWGVLSSSPHVCLVLKKVFYMKNDKEKRSDLRLLYSTSLVARKVFDTWAQRKQARDKSSVASTTINAGVEDDEKVKDLFRTLQEYGFGRYIKASRGGEARFEWGLIDENEPYFKYSLIAVARIAKGSNEAWDGSESVSSVEDEAVSSPHSLSVPGSSVSIKLAMNDISVQLELPKHFDPDEDFEDLEDLLELIKASVKSKFKRRRA
jgi:hypothetical protein